MTKYLTIAVLICCLVGLWATRPSASIVECEKINLPEYCQILNKE